MVGFGTTSSPGVRLLRAPVTAGLRPERIDTHEPNVRGIGVDASRTRSASLRNSSTSGRRPALPPKRLQFLQAQRIDSQQDDVRLRGHMQTGKQVETIGEQPGPDQRQNKVAAVTLQRRRRTECRRR